MFAAIVEILVIVFLGWLISTQIIVPAMQGRALFSIFRKESKIEAEIVEVEQKLHEEELKKVVKIKKRQLTKSRKGAK